VGYDDDLWLAVPEDRAPAPAHLVEFVRGLGDCGRALDVGCGDGLLSAELRAGDLVAADVSRVALDRARRRLPAARLVLLGADARLPLPDSDRDLVLCTRALDHVRDVQLLLSEARRVLRPGGRLAVSAPAHGRLTGLELLVRGFERRFDPHLPHLRFFTRRSLAELLDAGGFDDVTIRRAGGDLLVTARR
jgi:SAM-dependent methyltransferase